MASLIQQRGLFYAQFFAKHQSPQRRQIPLHTRTKKTALILLRRLEDDYALGRFDPWALKEAAPIQLSTVADAVAAFLDTKAHLRHDTVRCFRSVLGLFLAFLGEKKPLAALTSAKVADFLATRSTGDVTRKNYLRHLRVFSRWLVAQEAVPKDFTAEVKVRRVPDRFPKYLTPEELDVLLGLIRSSRHHGWLGDVVEVTAFLGLRLGEVCALKWEAVDFHRGCLTVANGADFTTKSGKERTLPLPERALRVLADLKTTRNPATPKEYVFLTRNGARLNKDNLSHLFTRYRREAGLSDEISFHALRHTSASWLMMNGASIEAVRLYLGHSSITVTQKYAHLSPHAYAEQITSAMGKVGR